MARPPGAMHPSESAEREIPVIGIAGGIGSGKSEVARLLGEMGCCVTHSDEDVREVLGRQEVADVLAGWWGMGILTPEGKIDRGAIAKIVFEDGSARKRLEGLLHPLVEARRKQVWEEAAAKGPVTAFVIDAPLLFEAGLAEKCDAVIFVDAPAEARRERVKSRRGWDDGELDRREKNQWPLETKRERSDYLIVNDTDVAALRRRVRLTLDEILTHSARRRSSKGLRPAP